MPATINPAPANTLSDTGSFKNRKDKMITNTRLPLSMALTADTCPAWITANSADKSAYKIHACTGVSLKAKGDGMPALTVSITDDQLLGIRNFFNDGEPKAQRFATLLVFSKTFKQLIRSYVQWLAGV